MAKVIKYTESEAQRFFAIQFNGKTWELLDKPDRTPDEVERMADYAHASLAHWRSSGTCVHHQRGEWMLARVHTVLGESGAALKHAKRCLELTEQHKAELKDFDFAYAYEGIARAHALAGSRAEALKYIANAQKAGEVIAGKGDRKIFFGDFDGGNWYGVI